MNNEMLYISEAFLPDSFGYTEEKYEDASGAKTKIITEGEFQRADTNNGNERVYSEAILSRETNKLSKFIAERNGLPMELDHPIPDPKNEDVSMVQLQRPGLLNSCALCIQLEMHGKIVYGKAEILEGDHGAGDKLASMIRRKFKPAVSSRGIGPKMVRNAQGVYVIPESFNMITYDFVTKPSTHNAVLNCYMEEQMRSEYKRRKLYQVLVDIKGDSVI